MVTKNITYSGINSVDFTSGIYGLNGEPALLESDISTSNEEHIVLENQADLSLNDGTPYQSSLHLFLQVAYQ